MTDFGSVVACHHGPGDRKSYLEVAESLNSDGDELFRSHRYEEALACYLQVLEQFGKVREGELGRQVRTALGRKGGALVMLNRLTEASGAFDELCARTSHASDPKRALAQARDMIMRVIDVQARALLKAKRYRGGDRDC